MADTTTIPWCDKTWNPWEGCTKWSPGCINCYAENRNKRFSGGRNWGAGAPRRRTTEDNWKQPLKWNREARDTGTRPRVFSASLADWLDAEVPIEWLADFLGVIWQTPNLDWLLLTKRPENWQDRMRAVMDFLNAKGGEMTDLQYCTAIMVSRWLNADTWGRPPVHVWIGTTVEDQTRADERIPVLLSIPARVRFLSCEPLLEPVNLTHCAPYTLCGDANNPGYLNAFNGMSRHPKTVIRESNGRGTAEGIQWVIAGCESGAKRRPMGTDWALALFGQCEMAGVAFFMKQLVVNGQVSEDLTAFPEALQVRQFPEVSR